MARILVAYGTKYGSTAEIAARVGQRFTDAGFDTDVLQANSGIDITKYDGLVVGSPIYGGKWLADPTLILVVNHERLRTMPIVLFSVGMIDVKHPGKLRELHDAWVEEAFVQEDVRLNVIASGTFGGAYWRRNLPFWMRIVDSMFRFSPQGDYRQWDQIETWADETAQSLRRIIAGTDDAVDRSPEC